MRWWRPAHQAHNRSMGTSGRSVSLVFLVCPATSAVSLLVCVYFSWRNNSWVHTFKVVSLNFFFSCYSTAFILSTPVSVVITRSFVYCFSSTYTSSNFPDRFPSERRRLAVCLSHCGDHMGREATLSILLSGWCAPVFRARLLDEALKLPSVT